jgi:glycosyltransferase involved in cell wall biosynthesis
MFMTVLWYVLLGFLALKLAGLLVNLWQFPVLSLAAQTGMAHRHSGRVSLLVPARDEAETLPLTLPGLLAQPADEILVLDDGSRDGTLEVAQALAATDLRVRLLRGAPLPDGWIGKNWACQQLAEAASGEVLVFTDADVLWRPGALPALVSEMARQKAAAFSVFPRQQTETLGERVLLPLIDDMLLSFLPFVLLRLPAPSAAVANGQVFAFQRSAYQRLGGHRAVKGEILEDIRLARRVRRAGLQLGLALGGKLIAVRMYRGYGALVQGFAKSLLAAHGESRGFLIATALGHLLVYTLPPILAFTAPRWGVPVALAFAERGLVNLKTGRGAYWEALLMPLAPLLALPICLRALRPRRVWKGRAYP